ncbi:unnamed protein product [Paramecium octaurelia]|uniref:Uncharacterized protein n=1 Tax=Paramecium octaurelia TaxID=43137 RepID=A0A8S1XV00_PAROT|nr:unnamed protein product [Paramecium octaurelia]
MYYQLPLAWTMLAFLPIASRKIEAIHHLKLELLRYQNRINLLYHYIYQRSKICIRKGQCCSLINPPSNFIIIQCIRLCQPFIIDIFRVYFKKQKLPFIEQFYKIIRSIKADCFLTKYINNQLKKLNNREYRRKTNFAKLRSHLIQISKLQIGNQKQ